MAPIVIIKRPGSYSQLFRGPVQIINVEDVASYSWLARSDPTILVPGIPPVWRPPPLGRTLFRDKGPYMIDEAAYRNPPCPLESVLRAVIAERPTFDFTKMDVIIDRRLFYTLLNFIIGSDDAFEFGVETLGSTVLFTRKEPRLQGDTSESETMAWQEAFQLEYTDISVAAGNSTSYNRIIQYDFGGLRYLVTSVVDACVEIDGLLIRTEQPENWRIDGCPISSSKLSSRSSTRKASESPVSSEMIVINGGRKLPNSAMLEWDLYHNSTKAPYSMTEMLPDLWLAQVFNLVTAGYRLVTRHSQMLADFFSIDVSTTKEQVQKWEGDNQVDLRRLTVLFERILLASRTRNCPCVIRRIAREAELEVWTVEKGGNYPLIPKDLREKWSESAMVE